LRLFCAVPGGAGTAGRALREAGWRGDPGALAPWLELAAGHVDAVHLSVDVTADTVLPGVGVELSLAGTPQPAADPRWAGLLDALVRRGACTPGKRDAVCA